MWLMEQSWCLFGHVVLHHHVLCKNSFCVQPAPAAWAHVKV